MPLIDYCHCRHYAATPPITSRRHALLRRFHDTQPLRPLRRFYCRQRHSPPPETPLRYAADGFAFAAAFRREAFRCAAAIFAALMPLAAAYDAWLRFIRRLIRTCHMRAASFQPTSPEIFFEPHSMPLPPDAAIACRL